MPEPTQDGNAAYVPCNGPRDCVGTEQGCSHCGMPEQDSLFPAPEPATPLRRKDGEWPIHSGDRPDLGSGPPVGLDELEDFVIREVFVRCTTCKGSGLDGECECGGTGFDWGYTDEVRALLTKLTSEADRG